LLLGVCQSAVAVAFVCAGVLKLAQPSSAGDALKELGVSRALEAPLTFGLGLFELVLGVLLVAIGGPVVMSVAAIVLVAFTAVLARLHRRAPDASCGCLGDLSTPGGHVRGIARNTCLLTLLAVALVGGSSDVEPLALVAGFQLTLAIVVATEGVPVVLGLRRLGSELMEEA
jgi:hypothetical protein